MERELTAEELRDAIAAMPDREEPDFLRPHRATVTHQPPTATMSLEGFKTALLKRRLAEIDAADRARVVSKTTIAREIKTIKHELRGTKARAAAARLASRHREIAEETREARADAERAKRRVAQLREELEEEAKDIEKAIKEEREERVVALKENENKREERRAVVEAEIERQRAKRHKLVGSLKDIIAQQKELQKSM